MEYDESSIMVLNDVLALIRRRPKMFVGETAPEFVPEFLATRLAGDVLSLGAKQVEIHHAGDWWATASDEDWLAYQYQGQLARHYSGLGTRDIFNRILPVPGHVNSCRSEVVIHALAASVFTAKAEALVVLSGDEAKVRGLLARDPFNGLGEKRVVAFTMAEG
jgi:hypothetical protein